MGSRMGSRVGFKNLTAAAVSAVFPLMALLTSYFWRYLMIPPFFIF